MTESNTRSGIPLKSFYRPEDVEGLDDDHQLGAPGEYPYTRGRSETAVKGWMQREMSGEGVPSRSNEQLLHLESNVAKLVDPSGGSYYVESLTDELEKRIWSRVLEIEAMGDPADLSGKGWFKRFFDDTMADYSRRIADGSLPKVGLNIFQIPEEEDTLLKEIVEGKIEPYGSRIDEIKGYKKSRDAGKIRGIPKEVHRKARDPSENLVYATIEAFSAGATMGEIAGMMRIAYDDPYDPHGMIESPV